MLIETKSPYFVIRVNHYCAKFVETKFPVTDMERYNPSDKTFTLVR